MHAAANPCAAAAGTRSDDALLKRRHKRHSFISGSRSYLSVMQSTGRNVTLTPNLFSKTSKTNLLERKFSR